MVGIAVRTRLSAMTAAVCAALALSALPDSVMPAAQADSVAYLINVTMRPGYHFPNAQAALDYGGAVCAKVQSGIPYAGVMAHTKNDFDTNDEYQASYLIIQAVNELCPDHIWQLRNSAAGYRPPAQ